MYNLNVNLATGPGNPNLLSLEGVCTTPKTPEILNSLMAMTNPFEHGFAVGRSSVVGPRIAACPPANSDSSSSGSPLGSPSTPPSVQHTCSQLIKEGLKLTIQTKRRHNGQDTEQDDSYQRPHKMARREEVSLHNDDDDDYDDLFSPGIGLTAEDEERRRRRRERNKVAATKCRLKKRERTVNLVQESEILENQNHDLKTQIQELETQRRRLMDMLSLHRPTCIKNHLQYGPTQDIDTGLKYSPLQDIDPRTPSSSYCSDTPMSSYCSSSPLDTPVTTASSYGHYTIDSCNYSGGYTSQGMDNGGCMA